MQRLTQLRPRVERLKPRIGATVSGHGWEKGDLTGKRIVGTTLQNRNKVIKQRDHYICQKCKRLFMPNELVVDHRIPLSEGGSEDHNNLQSLCIPCHDLKSKDERATINSGPRPCY